MQTAEATSLPSEVDLEKDLGLVVMGDETKMLVPYVASVHARRWSPAGPGGNYGSCEC